MAALERRRKQLPTSEPFFPFAWKATSLPLRNDAQTLIDIFGSTQVRDLGVIAH